MAKKTPKTKSKMPGTKRAKMAPTKKKVKPSARKARGAGSLRGLDRDIADGTAILTIAPDGFSNQSKR